jgi:hypothetical protein
MPQDFVHQSQAEHNEKAANFVKNAYPDWAVTMCFYAAIHWVFQITERGSKGIS